MKLNATLIKVNKYENIYYYFFFCKVDRKQLAQNFKKLLQIHNMQQRAKI